MLKSYKKSDLFGYFWILPAFLLICVFSVYPALSALLHSFTEWDLVNVEFIGIDNFKRLFSDKIFWKSCGNLLILMSTGLVLGNLAPPHACGTAAQPEERKMEQRLSIYFRYSHAGTRHGEYAYLDENRVQSFPERIGEQHSGQPFRGERERVVF